jgi:hypothetical protein
VRFFYYKNKTNNYGKNSDLNSLCCYCNNIWAIAISDDGSVADASAILDVKSTTKGFAATYDRSSA